MFDGPYRHGNDIDSSVAGAGNRLAADPLALIEHLEARLDRSERENQARIRTIERRLESLANGVEGLRGGDAERQRQMELSVVDLADRLGRIEAAGQR